MLYFDQKILTKKYFNFIIPSLILIISKSLNSERTIAISPDLMKKTIDLFIKGLIN